MAIRISCPSCDASLSFDDGKLGKKVRCKKCEEAFTLAETNGKSKKTQHADEGDDDADRPAKKKKPAKQGSPLGMILVGAGAFLLVAVAGVLGLGAWWFLGKKPPSESPNAHHVAPETKRAPEPEPKIEPEPEPVKKEEPKTGPPPLSPELQKVKDATVFISATMPGGRKYEGTGFIAVEDGVVLTNASVLGMLDANGVLVPNAPTQIDVILYPGASNEAKQKAATLGVDRKLDLVALRIGAPKLPAFLMLEDTAKVNQDQAVHVASYPFEAKMRKDFSLVPTAIARLKKGAMGKLDELQVGGGINRANSGGPVVTTSGAVVGISAGDEKARLATPADVVKRFLDGKVGEAALGKIVQAGKDSKVSATYPLSDPLKRIKEVRVEVWAGGPGPDRPYSYTPPAKVPGDGERKSQPLTVQKNSATGDAILPATIPTGQVVWLQPVITLKDNSIQWGVATSIKPPPVSPYDLKPANLTVKLQNPVDRTVKLDATFTTNLKKTTTTAHITADVRESMGSDPDGAQMKTAYGNVTNTDGQNTATAKPILDLVHQIPTTYVVDNTNKVTKRTFRPLDGKTAKDSKDPALTMEYELGTALEAGIVPMPNRTVQPMETWNTVYPIMFRNKQKTAEGTITLTSTYQGFLKRNNRNEAIVTVTGNLTFPSNPDFKTFEGTVTGKIGFDEPGGYISSTQLKFTSNSSKDSFSLDVDLQRNAGNTSNIQLVQDTKPADPVPVPTGKPKTIFDQKGNLTTGSPSDPGLSDPNPKKKKVAYKQDLQSQAMMQQGKTYTIHVTAMGFEPYIKLVTPAGVVAQQAGKMLTYRATAATPFTVSVISHNGKVGAFHVTVQESP